MAFKNWMYDPRSVNGDCRVSSHLTTLHYVPNYRENLSGHADPTSGTNYIIRHLTFERRLCLTRNLSGQEVGLAFLRLTMNSNQQRNTP